VRDALAGTGLSAALPTVELTETVLVEAGHATLAALHTLREMGVRIAIDDFGTGYAGLRHLAQLPTTGVEIDKSFTSGLPDDPTSVTIASLARDLDLSCVAEGIETDAQLAGAAVRAGRPGLAAGQAGVLRRDRRAARRPIVRRVPRPARADRSFGLGLLSRA
jgi:EAL domain-containing protein (putative c-di-GMP-specific phosphodiesterase class I)